MVEEGGKREGAGSACRENGCRALAGGTEARLSSDHQPHFSVCVCVCARQGQKKGSGAILALLELLLGSALAWWHRVGSVFMCVCVALCCGMLNRIRGDLVRSSWYRDHGTAARVCVYVCVVCIIGLAVTWCGTVGVLV